MESIAEEKVGVSRGHGKGENSLSMVTCVDVNSDDESVSTQGSISNELAYPANFVQNQTKVGTFGEVRIENSQDVHFGNKIFAAPITVVNAVGEEQQDKLGILGALRERFPNNFMENETFNQFKNGKLQCELFWYYITGGVLLITATILIVVSITMWNKYNEEIVETEEFFINETWFIQRSVWKAREPANRELLRLPVKYLSICHTVSSFYNTSKSCTDYVVRLQQVLMLQDCNDIAFNYLVCGNGDVYEGVGSNAQGEHSRGINRDSIGLAFIGDYSRSHYLTEQQIQNTKIMITELITQNKLSSEYILIPSGAVNGLDSPGKNVLNVIKHWEHYQASWKTKEISNLKDRS